MPPRRVSLSSIRQLRQYRSKIKPEVIKNDLIGGLAEEGRRLIMLAYASRGFENRTKNLKDSYVSAVFDGNRLIPETVRFISETPEATQAHTSGLKGREEAMLFLETMGRQIRRKEGLSLIIGATMFYSSILENMKPPYRVLANIQTDLEELAKIGVKGLKYVTKYDLQGNNPYVYRVSRKK
jgi:hypothetical protein